LVVLSAVELEAAFFSGWAFLMLGEVGFVLELLLWDESSGLCANAAAATVHLALRIPGDDERTYLGRQH
jgi:hypothetical protein